jgi:copper chaperone NosL
VKQLLGFALVALSLFALIGCGQDVDTEKPPDIVYGQDVCDRCNMIINEEKFAAAYWTEDGEARRFDDIGGMLAYTSEKDDVVASYWVHDYATGEWMRAEGAYYVLNSDLMTPMGFGIAAFAEKDQAEAMSQGLEGVAVLPFMELLDMDIKMPGDLHGMGHEHDESQSLPGG